METIHRVIKFVRHFCVYFDTRFTFSEVFINLHVKYTLFQIMCDKYTGNLKTVEL